MKKRAKAQRNQKTANEKPQGLNIRKFVFLYLGLMAIFFLIFNLVPIARIVDINGIYTRGVVLMTSMVLNILNIPTSPQGSIIHLPYISLELKFGCNGLEAIMIYSIAVLAYPSKWIRKLYGILAGLLCIQFINILRIIGLAYAAVYLKDLFNYIHLYIAQGIMIAVALGMFFLYLSYIRTDEKSVA